jgi:CDGSH-type Zn-finger protein
MTNSVQPQIDGPLRVAGELECVAQEGAGIERCAELWLCRCGQSGSKPYCDGSHARAGFSDAGRVPGDYRPKVAGAGDPAQLIRISFKRDGPVRCEGAMQVCDAGGAVAWSGAQASFCRCGASRNKPFCDGTHRDIGFAAP